MYIMSYVIFFGKKYSICSGKIINITFSFIVCYDLMIKTRSVHKILFTLVTWIKLWKQKCDIYKVIHIYHTISTFWNSAVYKIKLQTNSKTQYLCQETKLETLSLRN